MELEPRRRNSDWERKSIPMSRWVDENPWKNLALNVVLVVAINVWAFTVDPGYLSGLIPLSLVWLIGLAFGYKVKRPEEPDPPYPPPPTSL